MGHDPRALAVTGDDLWVTNFADGTVSRINVAGRTRSSTRSRSGSGPDAIAAGPAGLWVANSGDNTIQRIDTDDAAPRATPSTSGTARTAWRSTTPRSGSPTAETAR